MKRIISAVICIIILASLTACDKSTDSGEQDLSGLSVNTEPTPEAAASSGFGGEIEVVCYQTMTYKAFLDEAAAAFEAKYPGTKINITSFSKMPEVKTMTTEYGSAVSFVETGDDAKEMQDYISRINTELISGGGPDIMAMDVLPYYKYAESGFLEDLGARAEADKSFEISNYRENIFKSIKYKGGLYMMPLDFGFEFISFNKTLLNEEAQDKLREMGKFTYEEMIGLAKEQFHGDDSGARMIDFQGKAQALRKLIRSEYSKYIDLENKKANFKDESFINLLNMIQEQGDRGYFTPSFDNPDEMTQDFIDSWSDYYFKSQSNYILSGIYLPEDEAITRSGAFASPMIDEIAGLLVNNNNEALYRCYQAYGINSNSQNKELAWEFIKFMLNDEMQSSFNILGMPVNNKAFDEYTKINLIKFPNYRQGGGIDGYHEIADQKFLDAYDEYMKRLNGFINALNLYSIEDEILNEMIDKAASMFFDGTRTADETAEILQNQVQMYLSE